MQLSTFSNLRKPSHTVSRKTFQGQSPKFTGAAEQAVLRKQYEAFQQNDPGTIQRLAEMIYADTKRYNDPSPEARLEWTKKWAELNHRYSQEDPQVKIVFDDVMATSSVFKDKDVSSPDFMSKKRKAVEHFMDILYALEPLIKPIWDKIDDPMLRTYNFKVLENIFDGWMNKIEQWAADPKSDKNKLPRP